MKYDAEFCQQIRISEDAKKDCLALIAEILHLATTARNYGLLSLGKEAEENSSFLLRKGLQLALDGVKSPTARTILELYILTGDYTGKDLLKRCLIVEGVVGILDGMHPKLLKELLLAFLGESGHATYRESFEAREKEKLGSYLKNIAEKPAESKSAAKLGEVIVHLNDTAVERFLKIINIQDLAKAIKDLEGRVQTKLFNHLPQRGALLLLETIEQLNSVTPSEIRKAQAKVVAAISELKEQGYTS